MKRLAALAALLVVASCTRAAPPAPARAPPLSGDALVVVATPHAQALARWVELAWWDRTAKRPLTPPPATELKGAEEALLAWDGSLPPAVACDPRRFPSAIVTVGKAVATAASPTAPGPFVAAGRLTRALLGAPDAGLRDVGLEIARALTERRADAPALPPLGDLPAAERFIRDYAALVGDCKAADVKRLHRTDAKAGELALAQRRELLEQSKASASPAPEARIDAEAELVRRLYAETGPLLAGRSPADATALVERRAKEARSSRPDVYALRMGAGNGLVGIAKAYEAYVALGATLR